jgi:hypothetical protein
MLHKKIQFKEGGRMRNKNEEALGINVDEGLYCMQCVTKEIMAEADPEDYVWVRDVERQDEMVFCDCEDHVGPRRIY